eukprot:m51a1_g12771 hypothetical protein (159) ;mRNA; f:543-3280
MGDSKARPLPAAPLDVRVLGGRWLVAGGVAVGPRLNMSALDGVAQLQWAAADPNASLAYVLRSYFDWESLPAQGSSQALPPFALSGLSPAGAVPRELSPWNVSVRCAARFSGAVHVVAVVWDDATGQAYAPVDVAVGWACVDPRCDPACESSGHGTCE